MRALTTTLLGVALTALASAAATAPEGTLPDFVLDVQPVLTAAGCNAGGCHGAALGQSGFKLSLYGHEPRADWEAITRQLRGRRVDLARPEQSLVLRKPSRQLPHRGGRVLPRDGEGFEIVERWIRAGAPFRTSERELAALELAGEEQLTVTARYDNGTQRDVTRWTRFESADDSVARIEDGWRLERLRPGRTSVVARYGGLTAVRPVVVPFGEVEFEFPALSFVDEHVARGWRELGEAPPEPCSDLAFLRRATLDLTGRLPTVAAVLAFEADPDREALVDRLMASEAFADYWAYRLAELFPSSLDLVQWLRAELREDRPWDELASEILLATGDHPGRALYRSNDPKLIAENLFEGFLGQRIHCAQCHNHPFMSFRQRDYFGVSAFFARLRFEEGSVELARRGEVRLPGTQEIVQASLPGLGPAQVAEGGERRGGLAHWVVEQDEFAEVLVNRVWRALLGEGLFEPVDDRRPTNPAVNEELLAALAEDFRAHGYSLRRPFEVIAKSAVYGRRRTPRLLPAEVLHDAILDVTGAKGVKRAVLDPTLESELLDVSGRRADFEGSLAQSLHLITSAELQSQLDRMERVSLEELTLRALARRPTAAERALEPTSREDFEDLVWAVLTSSEFQHAE